jgi:DNA-binding CsgD family transcriptional regulator
MAKFMRNRPLKMMPREVGELNSPLMKNDMGLSDSVMHEQLWQEAHNVLSRFDSCTDKFMQILPEYMKMAGYIELDMARNPENACLLLKLLLEPIKEHYHQQKYPVFKELIRNTDGWADKLVDAGVSHWRTGIRVSMFLGYMKALLWAMQDAMNYVTDVSGQAFGQSSIAAAQKILTLYSDAFEVIWVELALMDPTKPRDADQEDASCLLTLEKCRFAKIFNITSDGVLVMDNDCRVIAVNTTLSSYVDDDWRGKFMWDVLGLESINTKEELFSAFPLETRFETALFQGKLFFRMGMTCLGEVSPAHRYEYVACLSDITRLVRQREFLKAEVDKQTSELVKEKKQLEEMNITLSNVIKNVNEEREKSLEELSQAIRRSIFPAIRKTSSEENRETRDAYTKILIEQLERLLAPTAGAIGKMGLNEPEDAKSNLGKLTLAEYRICQLVQAGNSNKKIAELLNISSETVKTHRRSIRRKLNLRGRHSHLGTILLNSQD